MDILFKVEDYDGTEVALAREVWHNKILHAVLGHPEVKEYFDEIRLTPHAPEAVFQSVGIPDPDFSTVQDSPGGFSRTIGSSW